MGLKEKPWWYCVSNRLTVKRHVCTVSKCSLNWLHPSRPNVKLREEGEEINIRYFENKMITAQCGISRPYYIPLYKTMSYFP